MAQIKLSPKRALAWVLTFVMMFAMLPMNALADEGGGLILVGGGVCICDSLCEDGKLYKEQAYTTEVTDLTGINGYT